MQPLNHPYLELTNCISFFGLRLDAASLVGLLLRSKLFLPSCLALLYLFLRRFADLIVVASSLCSNVASSLILLRRGCRVVLTMLFDEFVFASSRQYALQED